MSDTLNHSIQTQTRLAADLSAQLQHLQEQGALLLQMAEADDIATVCQWARRLEKALQDYICEAQHPVINLVVMGTTSSGKSSLVNLLCGAPIMPVDVQEMSAGIVVINHHPSHRALIIPPVAGLPDECAGEWTAIDDAEIAFRLQEAMDAWRRIRDDDANPPLFRIEIQYPTRLGTDPDRLAVAPALPVTPSTFQLRIIDLPGFQHLGDEYNLDIIRNEIRQALCLVVYNCEETDDTKQDELLRAIAAQMQIMQGLPQRMLFILNRIDACQRDSGDNHQTQRFTARTTARIQNLLKHALPEFSHEIDSLSMQPLSTYPALCAWTALNHPAQAVRALKTVSRHFGGLFSDALNATLPDHIADWSVADCRQVAEAVWQSSFGAAFDRALLDHIRQNLDHLLPPNLTGAIRRTVDDALTKLQDAQDRLTAAYDRYEQSHSRLNAVTADLDILRYRSRRLLLCMVDWPDDAPDVIQALTRIAGDLECVFILPEASLAALYDWSEHLHQPVEAYLNAVYERFWNVVVLNQDFGDRSLAQEGLVPPDHYEIKHILEQLCRSGYSKYARWGGFLSNNDYRAVQQLMGPLHELARTLTRHVNRLLSHHAGREIRRIQAALQLLVDHHAQLLCQKARNIAPELTRMTLTPPKLVYVRQRLFLNSHLTIDETLPFPYLANNRGCATKAESCCVQIPAIASIFTHFLSQLKTCRHEDAFFRWVRMQIEEYLTELDDYQKRMFSGQRRRLDKTVCCQAAAYNRFAAMLDDSIQLTARLNIMMNDT